MAKVSLRNHLRENFDSGDEKGSEVKNENIVEKEQIADEKLKNVTQEKVIPEVVIQSENKIFAESIFKGDDSAPKTKNKTQENKNSDKNSIFDRLNVNKRMLYIALGLAGIASFLVITYLMSISEERLLGSKMITVIVANKDIKEKTVLTISDLAKKQIPEKFVLKNSIIMDGKFDPQQLVGKLTLTDIYENEQLSLKRIVAKEESPWLSPSVPENHRAFTISSKSLSYIKPTDKVDVLVSLTDPQNRERKIITPVLQNSLVLAVDGKYKLSSDDEVSTGRDITVAVPNELLNLLTILDEKGNFQIALRRDNDQNNLETKYSPAQLEKILLYENKPTPVVNKPVVIKEVLVYVSAAPVKAKPVYNPPVVRKTIAKPVKPKPVVKSKPEVPKSIPKPVAPVQQQTVTVINGPRIDTQQVEVKGKE